MTEFPFLSLLVRVTILCAFQGGKKKITLDGMSEHRSGTVVVIHPVCISYLLSATSSGEGE